MTDPATSEPAPSARRRVLGPPSRTFHGGRARFAVDSVRPTETQPGKKVDTLPAIDIAVFDGDALTRAGLKAIIARQEGMRVLHETGDLDASLPQLQLAQPDLVIADARMASENEGAAIRAILRSAPQAKVIVFGMGTLEEEIFHALDAGAVGYLIRSAVDSTLVRAIRCVHATGSFIPEEIRLRFQRRQLRPRLTPRETHVLQLLSQARSNATISAVLGISVGTVKLHVKAILAKLGVEDRAEAAVVALERGFFRSQ